MSQDPYTTYIRYILQNQRKLPQIPVTEAQRDRYIQTGKTMGVSAADLKTGTTTDRQPTVSWQLLADATQTEVYTITKPLRLAVFAEAGLHSPGDFDSSQIEPNAKRNLVEALAPLCAGKSSAQLFVNELEKLYKEAAGKLPRAAYSGTPRTV